MTELELGGRVVVVTGAGGGLGRAHALALASRGAAVVVNDVGGDVHGRGASTAAHAAVGEIIAAGGRAVASDDSIATSAGGAAVIATAMHTYGRVDGVIHNAGILRDRSFAKLADADIDDVLAVHLFGAFHVLRPAWPIMKEQGFGRILLTTSASGLFGTFGQANYAAAKMGLVGLMHVLAVEGAPHGITANALAPTARTRMTEDLLGDLAGRFAPEHVAAVAAYLVSPACPLTHHIITAGGGRVSRVFLGSTPGWYSGPETATPEEIADALPEIADRERFIVPDSGMAEVELIRGVLGTQVPGGAP